MLPVSLEWAGAKRDFALAYGGLLDIEAACGKIGIGEIYVRLAGHRYSARDIWHVLRFALIGGGMTASEADTLMQDRFMTVPLTTSVEIAMEVLLAVFTGIEKDETHPAGDPAKPHDVGAVFAAFAQMGIAPDQVRAMRYADFVAMSRAFGGADTQPPTEEEFEDMLRKYGNA